MPNNESSSNPLLLIPSSHSQINAQSPSALKSSGNDALNSKDYILAGRMYTLGIDLILNGKLCKDLLPSELYALDEVSDGVLHALLSNRSLVMLKVLDLESAKEDAELCTLASPTFVKGHLRLLLALEADPSSTVSEKRSCISKALLSNPLNQELMNYEMRYALDSDGTNSADIDSAIDEVKVMQDTLNIANTLRDLEDPRRPMACGDVGSAYAVGAFGLEQNAILAEKYLKMGSELGDGVSARNLGLLYLDLARPGEAAAELHKASKLGDEQASEMLQRVAGEASVKKGEMIEKLKVMAEQGDERARKMLEEMELLGA